MGSEREATLNTLERTPILSSPEALDGPRTIAKVQRRLLPFLAVCFFANYLDRVNIGFAALEMNKDLGLSATIFGLGSGIFFFSYAAFEIPSNFMLERVGARLWIARILLSWGIVSALMALAWSESSFLALRLLLGLAEAGFFPGVVLYLTFWMPQASRAVAMSLFMLAIPISSVIGAPLSGFILDALHDVGGAKAWQWLFVIEALPSILLGIAAYFWLTDRPREARWLAPSEREWLQNTLDAERAAHPETAVESSLKMLLTPDVARLSVIYFGVVLTLYGLVFWLPQIVHDFGFASPLVVGLLTATPYVAGSVSMVFWSRHADRHGGHARHAALASLLSAAGLAACGALTSPALTILALSVSAAGTFAMFPIFWSFATRRLPPAQATGAIALINAIGALAGFLGPYLVGWVKDATGEFHYAPPALAIGPLISALLLATILRASAKTEVRA
ncbi:MFS transporter [Methylocystis bryophila]|uniref:MFS transporter n=1 Tax=Methylocystis bryophila TaxID=655015 RepID=UPI000A269D14|nr:MFS transporter [Methylocystis bryophila]